MWQWGWRNALLKELLRTTAISWRGQRSCPSWISALLASHHPPPQWSPADSPGQIRWASSCACSPLLRVPELEARRTVPWGDGSSLCPVWKCLRAVVLDWLTPTVQLQMSGPIRAPPAQWVVLSYLGTVLKVFLLLLLLPEHLTSFVCRIY